MDYVNLPTEGESLEVMKKHKEFLRHNPIVISSYDEAVIKMNDLMVNDGTRPRPTYTESIINAATIQFLCEDSQFKEDFKKAFKHIWLMLEMHQHKNSFMEGTVLRIEEPMQDVVKKGIRKLKRWNRLRRRGLLPASSITELLYLFITSHWDEVDIPKILYA